VTLAAGFLIGTKVPKNCESTYPKSSIPPIPISNRQSKSAIPCIYRLRPPPLPDDAWPSERGTALDEPVDGWLAEAVGWLAEAVGWLAETVGWLAGAIG
jgi:hypothetical protein